MRLPDLNNAALIRRYLETFERRFVRVDGEVIYQPEDGGSGVPMPRDEAAQLIAGMRASLCEVDAGHRLTGMTVVPVLIAVPMVLLIIGAIIDFQVAAQALIVPVTLAILLLGPALGAIRVELAWRRGLAHVADAIADREVLTPELVRQRVPFNPVRPVFIVATCLMVAVLAGLTIASATTPEFARAGIDRLIGRIAWPSVLLIAGLGFASRAIDAWRRRRVSEAEIADALALRRQRPF